MSIGRTLKGIYSSLDQSGFWRQVVHFGRPPTDRRDLGWITFRQAVLRECAVRAKTPLPRTELKDFCSLLVSAQPRIRPLPRNLYSPTWDESILLCSLVQQVRPRRILELGTFDGRTSVHLAENAPEAEVVTIELYPGEIPYFSGANRLGAVQTGRWIGHFDIENRVRQVIGDSGIIDLSSDGPFDFVFIDADHSYEAVIRDTSRVLPNLSPGGVVVWHDYSTTSGVTQALNELASGLPMLYVAGSSLVIHSASWTVGMTSAQMRESLAKTSGSAPS